MRATAEKGNQCYGVGKGDEKFRSSSSDWHTQEMSQLVLQPLRTQ
jgi:hypothetical protein